MPLGDLAAVITAVVAVVGSIDPAHAYYNRTAAT
jgi:hypothetical protein